MNAQINASIPFPMLFAERMPIFEVSISANMYDPVEQSISGLEAMGTTMTSVETATGGHGDTDTDSDSD